MDTMTRRLSAAAISGLVLLLAGCADGMEAASSVPGDGWFSTALPTGLATLARRGLPVSARLQVDQRPELDLDLDLLTERAVGDIPAVAGGRHRFALHFELRQDGTTRTLARGETWQLVPDYGEVSPDYRPWQFDDSDGDYYSDLRELLAGTDPSDPGHHPDSQPRRAGDYRLWDETGLRGQAGYRPTAGRGGGGVYELN